MVWVHRTNGTIDGSATAPPQPNDGGWSQVADNDPAFLTYQARINAPAPDWVLLSSLLNASAVWTNLNNWAGKSLDVNRDLYELLHGLGSVHDVTKLAATWNQLRTSLNTNSNKLMGTRDFSNAELTMIRGFLVQAGFDPIKFNLS